MIRICQIDNAASAPLERQDPVRAAGEAVAEIIATVREKGDQALIEYAARFDHAQLTSLEVTAGEIDAACAAMGPDFLSMLERAAANIRAFHSLQLERGFCYNERPGVVLGQKIIPIEKVGLYVPGGTAAYPSTVLMNAIPAKLAGVPQLVMVTPPGGGQLNPAVLAAAKVAGVDRIFKTGGAQAVAALAYGTETIPQVDKIVGPGNAYVAEAKRQVFGRVAIDMIAGPSEILIVADGACDPALVAADLLSQAEHDKNASAFLVTDDPALAQAVSAALENQIPQLERQDIARASIDDNGCIYLVPDLEQALELANRLAPEHLELCVERPFDWLDRVKNAGSVFLGRNCPEALGDYYAGPNHTLPTSGTARFASPLSVQDFVKRTQYIYYAEDSLAAAAPDVSRFARSEGLTAHARSVELRQERK